LSIVSPARRREQHGQQVQDAGASDRGDAAAATASASASEREVSVPGSIALG
jgi:hypothetical protein